ncbi:hypothetical protein BV501_02160 [Erwinia sp. OAMSP11]|nr:hypothetical protein BV501_02160 [Erwinia sp. OAMSP11]
MLQVNATSSDGRCALYCLTSFELLHSTFNSIRWHDAGFFLPLVWRYSVITPDYPRPDQPLLA